MHYVIIGINGQHFYTTYNDVIIVDYVLYIQYNCRLVIIRLSYTMHVLSQMIHLSIHPHSIDAYLAHAYSGHSYITQQRSVVNFS